MYTISSGYKTQRFGPRFLSLVLVGVVSNSRRSRANIGLHLEVSLIDIGQLEPLQKLFEPGLISRSHLIESSLQTSHVFAVESVNSIGDEESVFVGDWSRFSNHFYPFHRRTWFSLMLVFFLFEEELFAFGYRRRQKVHEFAW